MNPLQRQEFVSLYRTFLRLAAKWPADPIRPTRNFRTSLHSRLMEDFRKPLNAATESEVEATLQEARSQLAALKNVLGNTYKQENTLSEAMLTPAGNPKYYERLLASLDALSKAEKDPRGFFARLFGR
ncbi:hypothetical protein K493DRAFT_342482 [Basidiobolus meristosporus CBS 931.73]|uniref:Uncharacterized protein n=1 Tax=Basidiobolus meristosporus CBS 931.73 TaxID=1314790 RepID=A0A1Y1X6N7_9FUNG|nr:hypothetical protein K493DRAFT_342482 [Basidiobolus meristosporus CBS 931.73]|eukprot:ORX80954.1 hypothetical protein K493DRAFT_342482 [Basidiobolus meristosporus CBS 931.73]